MKTREHTMIGPMAVIFYGILLLGLSACDDGIGDDYYYDGAGSGSDDEMTITSSTSGNGGECVIHPDGTPSEALRAAWRGDEQSHARFHCYAACVPGQTRSANCETLRAYPTSDGITADRRCRYCGG